MERKQIIYILNLKARNLINKTFKIYDNHFTGSVTNSIDIEKMRELDNDLIFSKNGKLYTYGIINVNFDNSLKQIDESEIVFLVNGNKIEERKGKYTNTIMNRKEVRNYLYKNGFDIDIEGNIYHYIKYNRTPGKVKNNNILFIREDLVSMINFNNLYLNFSDDEIVDISSLYAANSLSMSDKIDEIVIHKDNILFIDSKEVEYKTIGSCTVLENDEVKQVEKETTLTHSIWDGQCLLDYSLMKGHSFSCIRNRMLKAAALSTNFSLYKSDNKIKYFIDKWGNKKQNVQLVLTKDCVKFMKFKHKFNSEEECWNYYLNEISDDEGYVHFGVVKWDHNSKNFGDWGNQLTYQVINSMNFTKDEMKELLQYSIDYINLLKNDLEVFKLHISLDSDKLNNRFILNMLNLNSDFQYTKEFKTFRTKQIFQYKEKLKSGKIPIEGASYNTMFSLPDYMLDCAAGKYKEPTEDGNIIYSTKFIENEEVFMFRNPHISSSGLTISKNTYKETYKYFDLNDNIILVNGGKSTIPESLNGCDFDSDTCFVSNNKLLIKVAKRNTFKIPVLEIEPKTVEYHFNIDDICDCDNKAGSNLIGEVCNVGALALSYYYHILHTNPYNKVDLKTLEDIVNMVSTVSMMAIDNCKREYPVNIPSILNSIRNNDIFKKDIKKCKKSKINDEDYQYIKEYETYNIILDFLYPDLEEDINVLCVKNELKSINIKNKNEMMKIEKEKIIKPLFMKSAQSDYKDNNLYQYFECSMDYVVTILDNETVSIKKNKTIDFGDLIKENRIAEKANRNLVKDLNDIASSYKNEINYICLNEDDAYIRKLKIKELEDETIRRISKRKITASTIYTILLRCYSNTKYRNENFVKNRKLLIKLLFESVPDIFKECIKEYRNNIFEYIEDENGDFERFGKKYKKIKVDN